MNIDLDKYINLAATQGPDMSAENKSSGGTGEYTPPVAGAVLLRFIGYIEIGQRREDYKGEVKIKDKVKLLFELHGRNYPVKETEDGLVAQRITITESISYHEKSNFKRLFLAMRNNDVSITHMAQMLGKGFRGRIYHKEFVGQDGQKKVFARLRDDNGYSIGPALAEDPETGEVKTIRIPECVSQPKVFLWRHADKAMWDNLYIDGEYSDGKSKNLFQNDITQAINFKGSAVDSLLNSSGIDEALSQYNTAPVVESKRAFGFTSSRPPQDFSDPFDDDYQPE